MLCVTQEYVYHSSSFLSPRRIRSFHLRLPMRVSKWGATSCMKVSAAVRVLFR